MENPNYVQSWILIGMAIYTGLILLVVLIRTWVKAKTLCPFFNCYCCGNCSPDGCTNCSCRTQQSVDNTFCCCPKNKSIDETTCLNLPSCKCTCFSPDCSYCRCFCCEVVCESDVKAKQMEYDVNIDFLDL